ncbi:integrin alpha-X-like, partial [Silurus meridionalis]
MAALKMGGILLPYIFLLSDVRGQIAGCRSLVEQLAKYANWGGSNCPSATDIAFLMDGSGSVSDQDFSEMKKFIVSMVNGLKDREFQGQIIMGAVGAFQWKGGYQMYNRKKEPSGTFQKGDSDDSYLGHGQLQQAHSLNSTWSCSRLGELTTFFKLQELHQGIALGIPEIMPGMASAFLYPRRSYIPKLPSVVTRPIRLQAFYPPPFKVPDLEKLNWLCPVQALDTYVHRLSLWGMSDQLFICCGPLRRGLPVNKQTLSRWIIDAIASSYKSSGRLAPFGVRAHLTQSYSMTVANVMQNNYIIQGAPRHNHTGKVIISDTTGTVHSLDSPEPQIGAYFGAELCVVDLDSNTLANLLLVSAPLHNEGDQEGKVFVYTFMESQVTYKHVLKGIPGQRGRFGMTLASPADLNRDGKMDVVVGAPLEDNGQGSIYIFNGRNADIAPTYSQ